MVNWLKAMEDDDFAVWSRHFKGDEVLIIAIEKHQVSVLETVRSANWSNGQRITMQILAQFPLYPFSSDGNPRDNVKFGIKSAEQFVRDYVPNVK